MIWTNESAESGRIWTNERSPLCLDGGGVPDEGGGHLEAPGRDVTDRCLDVVGDPLHEVRTVLVLDVEHLLVHLIH